MPVAHGEGCYFADDATLDALEADGQVLCRYVGADGEVAQPGDPANPNGSLRGDRRRDQRGRQRRRADAAPRDARSEAILGSDDGLGIIRSLVVSAASTHRPASSPAAGPGRASHDRARRPSRRRRSIARLGLEDVELDAIRPSSAATPTTSSSPCSA